MVVLGALQELASGVRQWRTSYKLALQDVELRYKRSFLGPFWISASLVTMVLALSYVFSSVLNHGFSEYVAYLGAGMLTWQLILTMTNEAAGSVIEHGSMMHNVRLPLTVVAGRVVIRCATTFAHNLVAILGLMLMFGATLSPIALLAFPGAILILLLGYFLTLVLGPICARYRDVPLVIQSLMSVIFFLTPILWMEGQSNRPMFTEFNPFYHMIELVRRPLLGEAPAQLNWIVVIWCCVAIAAAAVVTTVATRRRIALWI